jgi:hypothetical protein
VFISIVHYLISHLTDNLTTPQVRDIVTSTNQQYEAIIKKLENSKKSGVVQSGPGEMKNELKQYLQSLNDTSQNTANKTQSKTKDFSLLTMPGKQLNSDSNQQLHTYDSSDSVFGSYDDNAYSNY